MRLYRVALPDRLKKFQLPLALQLLMNNPGQVSFPEQGLKIE